MAYEWEHREYVLGRDDYSGSRDCATQEPGTRKPNYLLSKLKLSSKSMFDGNRRFHSTGQGDG